MNIYKIGGFEILEIVREGKLFEYYIKPYGKNDFLYAFGVLDKFTKDQLETLVSHGYFEDFE